MCRHASALLIRALRDTQRAFDVSRSGWRVVCGSLDLESLPNLPGYLSQQTDHYVLMNAVGQIIDITADQFGLDPFAVHRPSTFFSDEPRARAPGLQTSVRNWILHQSYPAILEEIGKSR